jgi:hypothetical protein
MSHQAEILYNLTVVALTPTRIYVSLLPLWGGCWNIYRGCIWPNISELFVSVLGFYVLRQMSTFYVYLYEFGHARCAFTLNSENR